MVFLKNGSDTLLLVIHEIYGINNHINDVCFDLFKKGFDVVCPDLLNLSKPFDYCDENIAYKYFLNNVDFDSSKKRVKEILKEFRVQYENIFIIGYSVGATIAWLCSDEGQYCDGIIGYYGSRIRDYIEVTPKCSVLLFFPEEEMSFNVDSLIEVLNAKDKTEVYQMPGKHGFCDPYSQRYCNESHMQTNKLMINFIKNIITGGCFNEY